MKRTDIYFIVLLLAEILFSSTVLLSSLASAQPPVCAWRGYAKVNVSGTVILANTSYILTSYTNGSQATNGTIESSGYYRINIPGNPGDNITLQICGVNVTQGYQTWSCDDPGYHILNISINTSENGEVCVYDCGCSSNHCAEDYDGVGKWCAASGSCMHDGTSYSNGATLCSDSSTKQTCSNGVWISETCPYGCSNGVCLSAPSGAGAGEVVTPVVEVTKTISTASPTSPAIAIIESDKAKDLKVDKVTLEVKETVSNVKITVKESSLPSGASVAISADVGKTYKYIEITTNVASEKVEKVKIKFKVEKSWITENNIASATIALQRWADNKWNKLPTSKVAEDETYIYFEAESPGLSTFAITGEKKAPELLPCPFECCIGEVNYTDKECPSGYECKENKCVAITVECVCGDWSDVGCGIAPCKANEMKQARKCTPAGCDVESRCVVDEKCIPPISPPKPKLPWGWIILAVIVAGAGVWYWYWRKRKTFRYSFQRYSRF
ncbi:MAG: PGF-pre-PGF domain-containing protein [Candidatus Heimdallarchaeaceae archaeon]